MATEQALQTFTRPAAANYASTGQYRFVDINTSSAAVLVSSAGAKGVGVLQNNPGSGEAASVAFSGISKVVAGGTVAAGAKVQSDANAAAITAATADHVFGTCIVGGDAGEIIEVLLGSQHILA